MCRAPRTGLREVPVNSPDLSSRRCGRAPRTQSLVFRSHQRSIIGINTSSAWPVFIGCDFAAITGLACIEHSGGARIHAVSMARSTWREPSTVSQQGNRKRIPAKRIYTRKFFAPDRGAVGTITTSPNTSHFGRIEIYLIISQPMKSCTRLGRFFARTKPALGRSSQNFPQAKKGLCMSFGFEARRKRAIAGPCRPQSQIPRPDHHSA